MRHLVAWKAVLVGVVSFAAVSLPAVGAIGQERGSEHVLFQAVRRGDSALLKDLLRRGTPPDVRADDGSTPLMYAALHGSTEMVELLLERGADPRAANKLNVTALLWGAQHAEKVRLLIDRGADPNARSDLGNTPLMVAAGLAQMVVARKTVAAASNNFFMVSTPYNGS